MRFVQYNVLSSSLCAPGWYVESAPEDLDPETRLERVLDKLEGEIAAGAIIGLQEVSCKWTGRLERFFDDRGYHVTSSLYGSRFTDFMGVSLAFPRADYSLLEVDVSCIGRTVDWAKPPPEKPPTSPLPVRAAKALWAALVNLCLALLFTELWLDAARRMCGWPKPKPARPYKSPIEHASGRFNRLVYFRLSSRRRGGAGEFGVGVYHMPCMFWSPPTMVVCAALVAQRMERLAKGAPSVLLVDFNAMPGSAPYRLLTTGQLPQDDPAYPELPEYEPWRPQLEVALSSAYAAFDREPEWTNHTVSGKPPKPFTGCLDYIFTSPQWQVEAVLPMPPLASAQLCPNAEEPSDHIMIAATLSIGRGPNVGRSGRGGSSATLRRRGSSATRAASPVVPAMRWSSRRRTPTRPLNVGTTRGQVY